MLFDLNVAVSDVCVSASGFFVVNSGFNVVSVLGYAADVSMVVCNSKVTSSKLST